MEVFGGAFGVQNVKSGCFDAFSATVLSQLPPRGGVWGFGLG
jgi:hypothetical protein